MQWAPWLEVTGMSDNYRKLIREYIYSEILDLNLSDIAKYI